MSSDTFQHGPIWLVAALAVAGCEPPAPPRHAEPAAPPEPFSFSLDVFDVGTGLAILVTGEDFTLLYDGGSNDDKKARADNRLLAYLNLALGASVEAECGPLEPASTAPRRLDHVFVSHPHRDHLGLLPDVFRCFEVGQVWESGLEGDSAASRTLEAAVAAEPGVRRHAGGTDFRAGDEIPLGRAARGIVLSVRPDARDPNDASIVVRLDLGTYRVLFTGDATGGERADPAEPPRRGSVEGELLERSRSELRADVLVVGHHGSKTSTRRDFLDAVAPSIAVVSSGPLPYGRVVLPDPEVIDLLESRDISVVRTDDDDTACRDATQKVGRDEDGAPGGCSAFRVVLDSTKPPRIERGPRSD